MSYVTYLGRRPEIAFSTPDQWEEGELYEVDRRTRHIHQWIFEPGSRRPVPPVVALFVAGLRRRIGPWFEIRMTHLEYRSVLVRARHLAEVSRDVSRLPHDMAIPLGLLRSDRRRWIKMARRWDAWVEARWHRGTYFSAKLVTMLNPGLAREIQASESKRMDVYNDAQPLADFAAGRPVAVYDPLDPSS